MHSGPVPFCKQKNWRPFLHSCIQQMRWRCFSRNYTRRLSKPFRRLASFKPGRTRDRCEMAGTVEVPLLERNAILRGGENDFRGSDGENQFGLRSHQLGVENRRCLTACPPIRKSSSPIPGTTKPTR